MAKLLELKNITKVYGTKVKNQVLFDINLDFEESSFNSIIGTSGSGKSTLMNIIGTLDTPTSGEVIIDGRSTANMNKDELAILRNETIGFIFQFHHLLPEFTVLENVLMPYRIKHNKVTKEALELADELIETVGLTKVKHNKATDLSGGQQQRAAIARSLINRPKIILGDEPTGNLDTETTKIVFNLLKKINEEFKSTFILITHDQKVAQLADRIIDIKDGRINMDIMN
ncbi:ABC transporter ATP-binding protein [Amphibacillus xylanus]|uniref:Putative ABC transporter ATP-binding protein n=1 Tax=Amphibacillus xylanus (strain ATCC 51415 / DSM 6626 / JCM 7361 / LMG 17667 / NBRC 15112 / Ep01) TaxID=698758 RepID=K0IXG2_AMPXN|nr:ABC transporter ATP-binding protein [Amphibacillus xylanus]BAM47089.1 putative ABC transporter ATP-binding protein [Amphibacillus xylanus NBRC 15112]